MRPTPFQAFVRIMIGCDKFCTYCIVPSVRGPEQSRPAAAHSGREPASWPTKAAAKSRCWGKPSTAIATRRRRPHLAADRSAGRSCTRSTASTGIKFVTNYPKDMTDDLLEAVRDLPKVSPYLHVPAQSGSNRMLKRMKRGYTVEEYREMMARIRADVPEAAVTSDFIVGFCGETDEDFQQTVELVRESRFKNSFIFKYSRAPGHQERLSSIPTTCPRTSRSAATTSCWPFRTRSARRTTSR